jgi:hypothetical protein
VKKIRMLGGIFIAGRGNYNVCEALVGKNGIFGGTMGRREDNFKWWVHNFWEDRGQVVGSACSLMLWYCTSKCDKESSQLC